MKRVIKTEERRLWLAAMRGTQPRGKSVTEAIDSVPPHLSFVDGHPTPLPRNEPAALPARSLDGETARRLKNKAARPQARLDLHGMIEAKAHEALIAFIEKARSRNYHLVLVITGKGRMGGGALRRNLPLWLEAPRLSAHIIGYAPALTVDGGDGAFYLHLRRDR